MATDVLTTPPVLDLPASRIASASREEGIVIVCVGGVSRPCPYEEESIAHLVLRMLGCDGDTAETLRPAFIARWQPAKVPWKYELAELRQWIEAQSC